MTLCLSVFYWVSSPTHTRIHSSPAKYLSTVRARSLAKPREGDGRSLGGKTERPRRGKRGGRRRAGAAAGRSSVCVAARRTAEGAGAESTPRRRSDVLSSPAEVGSALGFFQVALVS